MEKQKAGAANTGQTLHETTPDFTILDRFLSAFYPDPNEPIWLRHLPAKGSPGNQAARNLQTSRAALSSDAALTSELQSLNAQRGIYFVVNGGGNKDADITRFTACFAERDTGTLEEQNTILDAAPLPPSIRVETRKSIHVYWLLQDACTASEWREVQRALIAYFDSDTAIKNPSRVMRLPGFNHVSYNAESSEYTYKAVEVSHADPDRRYTASALLRAFGKPAVKSEDAARINDAFISDTPGDRETAKTILPHLSVERCNEYTGWLDVGIALYNIFGGEDEGLNQWREWSKKSPKYQPGACEEKWSTFSEQHGAAITIGSLIHWAREDSPDAFAEQAAAISLQARQDNFTVRGGFLYYTGKGKNGEAQNIRISAELSIRAKSRDAHSNEWGRLLEFSDPDGNLKRYAMPMSLLAGDGTQYRADLLRMGLYLEPSPTAKNLLTTYIQTFDTPARVRCVQKVGWFGSAFVLPDITIGDTGGEEAIFQPETMPEHRLTVSGSLVDWQNNIARYCAGNSRLAFAVSAAFAGCIAPLISQSGGGFHFRGSSSVGKTTALLVAGSVWGGNSKSGYIQTWRTTSNGLEAIAEIHNHGLLCLDEIGQCDAREIGEIAYQLANGQGKARMTKGISARKRIEYTLIFLSSGEHSLSDAVASTGKQIKGGQEVRMIDLEADTGKGFGLFENLHTFETPYQLAEHLSRAALAFNGSPIRAFLSGLVSANDIGPKWKAYRDAFVAAALSNQRVAGEVERVCNRFALVGFAGELATHLSVTGWPKQEATHAAQEMFRGWLSGRGSTGASDVENGIQAVRAFVESHGSSRFQSINQNSDLIDDRAHVNNRAGFKRAKDGVTEYLILPGIFRNEICKSYDSKAIAKELASRGMLRTQTKRGFTVNERVPELGQTGFYAVRLPD